MIRPAWPLIFGICAFSCTAAAADVKVAVASNFALPARSLAADFEHESGHSVVLITGSTGKLYAQIVNGAPFDVFLAADARRPQLLERNGMAVAGSRFTYARGPLVLWSLQAGLIDPQGKVLQKGVFRRLAIANPVHAPYGLAAREVLENLGLWSALQRKIVRGENIAQTYQFVATGNAELGFVSGSQLMDHVNRVQGSYWTVPLELYSPINQQAVLLADFDGARSFMSYLQGPRAAGLIRDFGYGPADDS